MKKIVITICFILTLLLSNIILFLPTKAESKTIIVPDDYSSIQTAIGHASAGDTIFVRSGRYTGGIALNKPITLKGEGAKTTTITGGATLKELNSTSTIQNTAAEKSIDTKQSFALLNRTTQTLNLETVSLEIQPVNFVPPPTFVIFINSSDITISDFTIMGGDNAISGNGDRLNIYENTLDGACSLEGSNIKVTNNTRIDMQIGGSHNLIVDNSGGGLTLTCSNSTILRNSLTYFASGNANSNVIVNNTLTGANMGLWIGAYSGSCSHNLFAGNRIENSGLWGILMGKGSYNVFFGNIVENTCAGTNVSVDGYGLALGGYHLVADNNLFVHNIFVNNSKNFGANWDVIGINSFDDGKEGNYWDDYLVKYPDASEVGQTGTGNIPYVVNGSNVDNHPLLRKPNVSDKVPVLPEPWQSFVSTLSLLPDSWSPSSNQLFSPTISILSPTNTSYVAIGDSYVDVPLTFVTNASLSWIGYSVDGKENVTAINGTSIKLPVGSQNLTLYANDTVGNWIIPQTVYYSVAWNGGIPPESFPWLPVTASVGIVAILGVSLLIYFKKHKHQES